MAHVPLQSQMGSEGWLFTILEIRKIHFPSGPYQALPTNEKSKSHEGITRASFVVKRNDRTQPPQT